MPSIGSGDSLSTLQGVRISTPGVLTSTHGVYLEMDLDGPIFFKADRKTTVQYTDGYISCPDAVWGDCRTPS
jgi:hypothetical protein